MTENLLDLNDTHPQGKREIYYTVELVCILCGREMADICCDVTHVPPHPIVLPKKETRVDHSKLRCTHCGGTFVVSGPFENSRYVVQQDIWETERTRRGRPPHWLVEARKQNGQDVQKQKARTKAEILALFPEWVRPPHVDVDRKVAARLWGDGLLERRFAKNAANPIPGTRAAEYQLTDRGRDFVRWNTPVELEEMTG